LCSTAIARDDGPPFAEEIRPMSGLVSRRTTRLAAACVAALALVLGALPGHAAAPRLLPAAAAPAPAPAAAPASVPDSGDSLAALIGALEARDRLRREADQAVQRAGQLSQLDTDLKAAESQFAELASQASAKGASTSGEQQLLDVDGSLRNLGLHVDDLVQQLREGTLALEEVLDHIRGENARWQARMAQSPADSAELLERMRQVQDELSSQAQRLRPQRDRLLELLDRATDLRSRMSALHADLVARREQIAETLRTAQQAPLWQLFGTARWDTEAVHAERRLQFRAVESYLGANAPWLLGVGLVVLLIGVVVLRQARARLEAEPPVESPSVVHTRAVLAHPYWAAVLIALFAMAVAAPSGGPVAFYDFGWLLVPVPAAVLVLRVLGPGMRNLVWALVAAVLLLPMRALADLDPLFDRLRMALQLGLVIAALGWELVRGYLPSTFPQRLRRTLQWAGALILVGLVVALYADIVGHVGLARTLRNGILGSLGVLLVVLALYHAGHALALGLLRMPLAQASRVVRRRRPRLERTLDKLLRACAVVGAALGVATSWGLASGMPGWFQEIDQAHVQIGEATLSIGALLAGAAILIGTYVAIVLLRLLLDDEILPRLHLKPGVPFAVSTLTRYTVAVVGFLFALAAAGIDLTKVTLLAGAIGVGVGLGLQNIVNNFISGLILLVERPIHVGDTVEIGPVNGVVQRIGIRASVLRTGQGADVIVPNGDLLSRQVTNWSAWDRQRRVDIDLRAPFDADPQQLIELLQAAAVAHAGVRKEPAPQALFIGFAENGLDLRLMAWVVDPDASGTVASELRSSLLAQLAGAGVELPLPRREVLLRPLPGGKETTDG
jgi:small-conductance mechanosensitive channel